MKRVLKVAAVLWALALVGWAIARAQGWIGGEGGELAADPALLHGTKSDAGEGARAKPEVGRVGPAAPVAPPAEGEKPPPVDLEYLGGTKSAPIVPPRPTKPATTQQPLLPTDDGALLPGTKANMVDGIGGLIGEKGTQMGSGGLGRKEEQKEPAQEAQEPPTQQQK